MPLITGKKLDNCIRLLGGTPTATAFVEDLNMLLRGHFQSLEEDPAHARTAGQQHKTLCNLLTLMDAALNSLRKIQCRDGEDLSVTRSDYATSSLIAAELHALRWEKLKSTFPMEDNLAEAHLKMCRSIPFGYPASLIDDLAEMRSAISRAEKKARPKPGNSDMKKKEQIEQGELAKNFVFRYRSRFGTFVPLGRDNNVHQVFGIFLHAANLSGIFSNDEARESEEANFSLLRKYVRGDRQLFDESPEVQAALTPSRTKTKPP